MTYCSEALLCSGTGRELDIRKPKINDFSCLCSVYSISNHQQALLLLLTTISPSHNKVAQKIFLHLNIYSPLGIGLNVINCYVTN
nr:MAG TPA: hypothetical protein [Caudoviricetes sp.]